MAILAIFSVALQLVEPLVIEHRLGLVPPATLWLAPGTAFAWPAPPNKETMNQALWRTAEGQTNILAAEFEPVPPPETHAGAALAGQDFAPIVMADGRTVHASAAYLVRFETGTSRPAPSFIATSKIGLQAEIRLFLDPTGYQLGTDIFVKPYLDGVPSEGSFTVWPPTGPVRNLSTAGGKTGSFTLDHPGIWAVRFEREEHAGGKSTVRTSTLWFEARNTGGLR